MGDERWNESVCRCETLYWNYKKEEEEFKKKNVLNAKGKVDIKQNKKLSTGMRE